MGRYSERYWDNRTTPLEEAVGAIFTAGLTTLMDDPDLAYHCEITDNETGIVGKTKEWMPSKTIAHNVAWNDLVEKQDDYYRNLRQQQQESSLRETISRSPAPKQETDLIVLLIKWAVYIGLFFVAIWLAFAVALPLLVINCALISLVIGLADRKTKNYMLPISVVGAIFLLIDYNKGWFTKTLVVNVSFFENAIPFFLYLNILTGLIASYFLIRDLINVKKPPLATDGEFCQRNLIIMGCLLVLGGGTVWGQNYFGGNKSTTISDITNQPGSTSGQSSTNQSQNVVQNTVAEDPNSAKNVNNYFSNGFFTGAYFTIKVPVGFAVRPSLKANVTGGGYGIYSSAFFQSPDQEVEFYIFSDGYNDEASDIAINSALEKETAKKVQNIGTKGFVKWTEIKALDNSYLKAYQETKNQVTNEHVIIGLKYKSQVTYNKYKALYLSFKKSYNMLGGD